MKVTVAEAKECMQALQFLSDKTSAWLDGLNESEFEVSPTLEAIRGGWFDRGAVNCMLDPASAANRLYGQFAAEAVVLLRILGAVRRA
jgi:hypothetical protein